MRIELLALLGLTACATAAPSSGDPASATRTSIVSLGSAENDMGSVVRVQSGTVLVRHSIPSNARLRATLLEGLDPTNRHLRYQWERDGTYDVEASGRYRHTVSGSMVGSGVLTLRSTLIYTPLPDTRVDSAEPEGP
jgi:hypothetical protein